MSTQDALITRAKSLATPVVSHVAARLNLGRLLGKCAREELLALVVVLAESADHAKLRAVVEATDTGEPWQERLRKAHTEAARLRRAGLHVPDEVAEMAREYKTQHERARRVNAKAAAREETAA